MGEGALARHVRRLSRRRFVGACGGALAVSLGGPRALRALGAARADPRGPRVRLLTEDGSRPLEASQLAHHRAYIFNYPYESTPCFLLDVGEKVPGARVPLRTGAAYAWSGGVGRRGSVVAFVAICPHNYTHPTRDLSMLHYSPPGRPAAVTQRDRVITCCAHGSSFDPTRGAVPLQPPAELPLAAVVLEWAAAADGLFATGVLGLPAFEEFFSNFPNRSRRLLEGSTPVWDLEHYCQFVLRC